MRKGTLHRPATEGVEVSEIMGKLEQPRWFRPQQRVGLSKLMRYDLELVIGLCTENDGLSSFKRVDIEFLSVGMNNDRLRRTYIFVKCCLFYICIVLFSINKGNGEAAISRTDRSIKVRMLHLCMELGSHRQQQNDKRKGDSFHDINLVGFYMRPYTVSYSKFRRKRR